MERIDVIAQVVGIPDGRTFEITDDSLGDKPVTLHFDGLEGCPINLKKRYRFRDILFYRGSLVADEYSTISE